MSRCLSFVSGTNINAALLSAAQLVNPLSTGSSNPLLSRRVPLVIFLTDGEATIGVTAGDTILSNAKEALGAASLFGLAFGDDADFLLLKRLALDNRGVARMVYEDADAALQLKGFYDEIANPLLSDVQLSYLEDQAFDITRSLFPNYFQGSELVVAGRVKQGVKDLKVSMSASDSKQRIKLENNVLISSVKENNSLTADCSGDLEGLSRIVHRLWAYFTIKELLLAKMNTTDPAVQRLLAEKATNLSLKYNFVTPVTSLVVVKPDTDDAAQAQTTAKPCPAATTTTTATASIKTAKSGTAKMLRSPPNPRPNKTKPNAPQPPQNTPHLKKRVIATSIARAVVSPSKKMTTSSPKTALNDPVTASPPPAGRIGPPPAPAQVSTHQHSNTTSFEVTDVTRPALSSALPGRPLPSQLSLAPASTEATIRTTSAPDAPQPEIATDLPALLTVPSPIPAPAVEHHNRDSGSDVNMATLVSATFAPMPGVTDGAQLWEAAGLLGRWKHTSYHHIPVALLITS